MKNKSLRKECLKYMEWETVHKVMVHLNWQWHSVGIPTVEEIRVCAKRLLKEAHNRAKKTQAIASISTGGLRAMAIYNTELQVVDEYILEFILTSWGAFDG